MKKIKSFWRISLIIFLIIIVAGLIIWRFFQPKNKESLTAQVKRGDLTKTLTLSGKIEAEEKVTLTFQTSGRLSWVGVKEGDQVKKYQAIASLDKRELQKKLERYLNDYRKTRNDFDQITKDDYQNQIITDKIKRILEKSQADLNKSVIDVELQALAMEYATIWSPIDGIVTKITSAWPGLDTTLANPAKFEIVNPQSLYFSASVEQAELKDIKEGMEGTLVLDAYPQKVINGQIKQISFSPKEGETGTVYEIKFTFEADNHDYSYRLGMTGDLTLTIAKKENVLFLPLTFVKEEADKKFVKVKKNGRWEKVYITTGLETEEAIEIVSGLTENEVVYD